MSRILVIGTANVDLTMAVDRLPERGETVSGGTFLQVMGGKGANQAVAAKRAGADVRLVTCVGKDAHGDAVLRAMQAEGIDTTGTRRSTNAATGVAVILFDRDGNNTIAVAPGANFDLQPAHLQQVFDNLPEYDLLVLQNELAPATLATILVAAAALNTPVLLNFAPAHTLDLHALAGKANVGLVVNETEAATLLGTPVDTAERAHVAAKTLLAHGLRFAIVTLGAQGCCVADAHGVFHQAAMQVQAVDATAAGDTFCGALAAELVAQRQENLRGAVRFATGAAALATRTAGAQSSIPQHAEIAAALRQWHGTV